MRNRKHLRNGKHNKKSSRILTFFQFFSWSIVILLFAFLLLDLYVSNCWIKTTSYSFSSTKVNEKIRVLQISDLHNAVFGRKNVALLRKVKKEKPDVILMTGDLVRSSSIKYEPAVSAIEGLSKIAPVYISLGNHEQDYMVKNPWVDLISLFEEAGGNVLDSAYKEIEINGSVVRIGGVYDLCYAEELSENTSEKGKFLHTFEETEGLKLLMAHLPVVWKDGDILDYWDVDCVFSGHLHGGQVCLPFVGAIYAPDQGWFPGIESGVFQGKSSDSRLILSAGLGKNNWVPRFHNRPELVVVDIVPSSKVE